MKATYAPPTTATDLLGTLTLTLDNGTILELAAKEVKPVQTYRIGMRFKDDFQDDVILAQVLADRVCAICLRSGNRLVNPVVVSDLQAINREELIKIFGSDKFTLIP